MDIQGVHFNNSVFTLVILFETVVPTYQCLSFPKWAQQASGHFSFTFYDQKRESTESRNFHGLTTTCYLNVTYFREY